MINHLALQTALKDKLGEKLGTYMFEDGLTAPAIGTIIGRNNYPPQNTRITGLECIILVDLGVGVRGLLGNAYEKTWRATVVLKLWEDADEEDEDEEDLIDYLSMLEAAIAEVPEIGIQPNSIKGMASENNLNNLQMLQLSVFQVEMTEHDEDDY